MNSTSIFEAAKQEWTKHICNILAPIIEEGFRNIYTNCVNEAMSSRNIEDNDQEEVNESVINSFQQTLCNIPRWSPEIVDIEYNRILNHDQDCHDVIDDLIRAAFTSYILIFSSAPTKKLDLVIPSSKRFIHKVYIEAARVFYRSPHLFFSLDGAEYRNHKNNARIEAIICSSIEDSIRKLMPIKMILQAYMQPKDAELIDEAIIDEVEDITRRVSPRSRRGLKGVLKNYIQTTSEVIEPKLEIKKIPVERSGEDDLSSYEDEERIKREHELMQPGNEISPPMSDNEDVFEIQHEFGNNRNKSIMKRRSSNDDREPQDDQDYREKRESRREKNRHNDKEESPSKYQSRRYDDEPRKYERESRESRGERSERESRGERSERESRNTQKSEREPRGERNERESRESRGARNERESRGERQKGGEQRNNTQKTHNSDREYGDRSRNRLPADTDEIPVGVPRAKSIEFRFDRADRDYTEAPLKKQVTYGGAQRNISLFESGKNDDLDESADGPESAADDPESADGPNGRYHREDDSDDRRRVHRRPVKHAGTPRKVRK